MAHINKVLRSVGTPDGTRCVDVYQSPDGRFGFAEYRRDPEDGSGWHPAGTPAETGFRSEAAALAEARRRVAWLDAVIG